MLRTSSLQLQETINDLTEIIVMRNRVAEKREFVNIEKLFDNVKKIYLNTLHDIPHELESDFGHTVARSDKSYLESIFINLLSNAVKYRRPERKLKIGISAGLNTEGFCVIRFSDNGLGFDTEKVGHKLFGMYQRFHSNPDGKGMGLFIIKSQITALGGTIDVESAVGKGTTFTITLPVE